MTGSVDNGLRSSASSVKGAQPSTGGPVIRGDVPGDARRKAGRAADTVMAGGAAFRGSTTPPGWSPNPEVGLLLCPPRPHGAVESVPVHPGFGGVWAGCGRPLAGAVLGLPWITLPATGTQRLLPGWALMTQNKGVPGSRTHSCSLD